MTRDQLASELAEVVRAGIEMRTEQIIYFKVRSTEALIASKNAEKRFDQLASRAMLFINAAERPVP